VPIYGTVKQKNLLEFQGDSGLMPWAFKDEEKKHLYLFWRKYETFKYSFQLDAFGIHVKVEHNPLTEEELAGLLPPNTIISFPPNISEFHIQFEEKISLNPLNIQKAGK